MTVPTVISEITFTTKEHKHVVFKTRGEYPTFNPESLDTDEHKNLEEPQARPIYFTATHTATAALNPQQLPVQASMLSQESLVDKQDDPDVNQVQLFEELWDSVMGVPLIPGIPGHPTATPSPSR